MWKVKNFIFRNQTFNIQINEILSLFLVKSQFTKIQDAVGGMTLVAGHTDLFFFNVLVKISQGLVFLIRVQVFLFQN